jgi:hypothetical protein
MQKNGRSLSEISLRPNDAPVKRVLRAVLGTVPVSWAAVLAQTAEAVAMVVAATDFWVTAFPFLASPAHFR